MIYSVCIVPWAFLTFHSFCICGIISRRVSISLEKIWVKSILLLESYLLLRQKVYVHLRRKFIYWMNIKWVGVFFFSLTHLMSCLCYDCFHLAKWQFFEFQHESCQHISLQILAWFRFSHSDDTTNLSCSSCVIFGKTFSTGVKPALNGIFICWLM